MYVGYDQDETDVVFGTYSSVKVLAGTGVT